MVQKQRNKKAQKAVTIHDLARQLGVSATTVSRALNNRGRMSRETRKRILQTASEYNYKPSLIARSLIHQRTKTLAVVVPMIGNTAYSPMVRGIEQIAYEKGYNIILCDTDINLDKERRYLEMLIQRRVEGAIIIPFAERNSGEYDHISQLEEEGIKVVVMEQDVPVDKLNRIVPDNRGDAKRLIEHLIDNGYRKIGLAHLGLRNWDIAGMERWEGYKQALEQAGIEYDEKLVIQAGQPTIVEEKTLLFDAVIDYLRQQDRPEAIFATTDMLAIKIMSVIHSLGLKIPEDIAVVGFDDILMSGYTSPPLTTVRQPAEQIGRRSAEIVFSLIEGDDELPLPVHERISGKLVIRKSCGNGKRREKKIDDWKKLTHVRSLSENCKL